MVFSFLYLAVRALFGALVRSRRGLHVKDIELLVLRHELEILRRQVARPKVGTADRHSVERRLSLLQPRRRPPAGEPAADNADVGADGALERRRSLLAHQRLVQPQAAPCHSRIAADDAQHLLVGCTDLPGGAARSRPRRLRRRTRRRAPLLGQRLDRARPASRAKRGTPRLGRLPAPPPALRRRAARPLPPPRPSATSSCRSSWCPTGRSRTSRPGSGRSPPPERAR